MADLPSSITASTSAAPLFNIGGIASGLDTNTIIGQLLAIERQPEVRAAQQQQVEEARQNALRDVNTRLTNLQTAIAGLRDVSTWGDVQTVTASDTANIGVARTGGAAPGGYQVQVTQLARAHQVTQSTGLANATDDDTLHIQVGTGAAIDVGVKSGDSLDTIAAKINGTSGIQVYASVVNSKLVLSGKVTGAANTIAVTSEDGLDADLGLAQSLAARDAKYTVDGGAVQSSASNVVTAAIPGVTLTFKGVMSTAASVVVGNPSPNTDVIQSKIQAFVDQYNSTVDFLNGKLKEQKVVNPSTADDRAKGVLNADPGLESILTQLRQAVGNTFTGAQPDLNQLSLVGLSTGKSVGSGTISQDSLEGLLTLDADKLSDMLTNRFSDVKKLFTNITGTYASEGLAQRLDDLVKPLVRTGGVLASRIDGAQTTINDLKQRQKDIETRVALRETQLRAQFTAMETALSQSQSLQSQLSGQFAALS
ncbi:MAG TPA: flagellar filament capping protein FliD, partial [Gaiellales bacterium]|nr:flagellar filament capping protein FliD [Gaiellales bacterium]